MKTIKSYIKWTISIILVLFLGVFTLQNSAELELKFLTWTFEARRAVVIAASFGSGLVIGWLFGISRRRR